MTWSSDAETPRIPAATETSGGTGPEPTREYVWPEPETERPSTSESAEAPTTVAPTTLGVVEAEPEPVVRSGNRVAGVALALLTTAFFAALYLIALTVIRLLGDRTGGDPVALGLAQALTALFLAPVAAFFIGLALIVLVVNRAGWWAYVLGGFLVAVLTAAAAFVGSWSAVGGLAVPAASSPLVDHLRDPVVLASVLAAGVLGREATVWGGALIAARARGVKRRNAEREAAASS